MERGTPTATTDDNGYYFFENGYPTGEWYVLEAYSDSYYTTGVTYQTDNQPHPTTVKGAGVDVSVLPIIGLSGRMDWGVHAYDPTGKQRRPAERRHRGHGQLRRDPQRGRPAVRRDRGLAAGDLRRAGGASRTGSLSHRREPAL